MKAQVACEIEDFLFNQSEFVYRCLRQETIGLALITRLGIGTAWYSRPEDWVSINSSLEKRRHSSFYHVLDSLKHNILKEEQQLSEELQKPLSLSSLDVKAAFQDISKIKRSTKLPDRRIRISHMMTCLVDRFLWASNPKQDECQPVLTPAQFPYQPYPSGDNFEKYVDLMKTWPYLVHTYLTALNAETLDTLAGIQQGDVPVLSLYYSMVSSSQNRIINTVVDNFSRCALALRALSHVSIPSLSMTTLKGMSIIEN
jgi:hypothetical protein